MQDIWRKPKEVFQKLKDIAEPVQVLGAMLWRAGPVLLIAYYTLALLTAVMPVIQLIAIKQIVDNIALITVERELALQNLLVWIVIFVMKMLAEALAESMGEWSMQVLAERSRIRINNELLDAIDAEDTLRYYEEPETRNRLETLRDTTQWLPHNLIRFPAYFISNLVSLIGVFLIIADFSLLLAVFLLLSLVPYATKQYKFKLLFWDSQLHQAPHRRMMGYSRNAVLSPDMVKEVKLFQNGAYFENLYEDAFQKMYQQLESQQKKGAQDSALSGLFAGLVVGLGYLWIVWEAVQGNLSPGNVALFLTGIYELANYAKNASATGATALENWHMAKDFLVFMKQDKKKEVIPVLPQSKPIEIKLENVSFSYPRTDQRVLENINLTIKPGEKVAIVGENGSGKTTLVKLLCQFYEPTSGQVLLNGKKASPEQREGISVVFQDFGRYAFPISTNIALGNVQRPENTDRIQLSAAFSGIHQDIIKYPHHYQTMLGREWGGQQLSGGQWQKVAIARSHYRQAQLLILDEPTASLDIRSEYKIYDRFSDYTDGKTTIIISHRFSTVKMADRIIVLKEGKIAESGSHEELMALEGEYADMYQKQAALFYLKEGETLESLG